MKWWKRWRWKSRFLNTCHVGGIYREQTLENGRKNRHLPKVKSISINEVNNTVEYLIELRIGINPEKVTENKWLFEQNLGNVLDLKISKAKYILLKIQHEG